MRDENTFGEVVVLSLLLCVSFSAEKLSFRGLPNSISGSSSILNLAFFDWDLDFDLKSDLVLPKRLNSVRKGIMAGFLFLNVATRSRAFLTALTCTRSILHLQPEQASRLLLALLKAELVLTCFFGSTSSTSHDWFGRSYFTILDLLLLDRESLSITLSYTSKALPVLTEHF